MSSGDKPMPMDEAIAHYAGRLSDKQKLEFLRVEFLAVSMMLHEKCEHAGDFNSCKRGICREARQALLDTEDK